MLSTCGKKELLDKIGMMRYTGVDGIDEILSNPNTDEEVMEKLARVTYDADNIRKLMNSPLFNSNTFAIICSRRLDDFSIFPDLLTSPFLTKEIYEKILARHPHNVDDLLLQSKFASEHTCATMLGDSLIGIGTSPELILKIINSPFFTANIFNTYLSTFYGTDDLLLAALKTKVATPELLSKIMNRIIKYAGTYQKSIRYIFKNYECPYEYFKTYVQLSDENIDFLIADGVVDIKLLKKLINDVNQKVAIRIINSKMITDELMILIINRDYSAGVYGMAAYNEAIYRAILEKPTLSEEVLKEIIKKKPPVAIQDMITKHPSASTDIKTSVIIGKSSLTATDLDTLFSIPGLTANHLVQLMNNHPVEIVFSRVMDCPLANQKLYRQIMKKVKNAGDSSSSQARINNKNILLKLLEKNLDENNLEYLISHVCGDYDIVKKVLQHPSAGLDVCKKASILADKMDEKKREEIEAMIAKVKHKVISETFEIEEEEDVRDILRVNVEDGMTTMLWGPSGVGKSSIVFEIDPTATLLILKNGMLPEEVIGGKEPNGQPGEIYPPHWYVVLCEKCQREPNRMHILFIDEFTNVSDTIKNLAWEIIGNRLVNGHEEWPLPDNCALVVAGNRPEESSAVRIDATGGVMPAPLHNRIDSMLEIKFNVDSWQKWALETNPETGRLRIHPIVLSFCAAHADKVMFTQFNPEAVTQPFLTPRKWEQLSAAIYKAEERGENHHISYARIRSILGNNSICEAFIEHYERLPIDMNKIVMGEYTEEDFPTLEDKMYALGIIIAQYDGDQETIESFILECLGDEFLSVYNNMRSERKAVLEATDNNISTNGGKK